MLQQKTMKESIEGFEHSTTLANQIAAVSTHTCVLQNKALEGTQGSRAGRPIAAAGMHMTNSCCEHTHLWRRIKPNEGFDHKSLEVWPTNCYCEHTQGQGLADHLLLVAYTCVFLGKPIEGHDQVLL